MRGLKSKGGARHSNGIADGVDRKGDLKTTQTNVTNGSGDGPGGVGEVEALHEIRSDDELLGSDDEGTSPRGVNADNGADDDGTITSSETEFKVYKRRWFGLVQLVLLNIIVSWDVSGTCGFQPASRQTALLLLMHNSGLPFLLTLRPLPSSTM